MKIRWGYLLAAGALVATTVPPLTAATLPLDPVVQSNLAFGQIIATSTTGTVTVSPAGNRSSSGGVSLGNSFGVSAASFAVSGDANSSYSIMLPASAVLSGGGSSMTLDGFDSNPRSSGHLSPAGTESVTVGATLHVGAQQVSAPYSGSYLVTLAYE